MAEEEKTKKSSSSERSDQAAQQGSGIATALVAGIAVAILEPELLAGVAIGVGAMLAPKLLPQLGAGLRPLVKTAVRASYAAAAKSREIAADASEQFQDMLAEVRAEREGGAPASAAGPQRQPARRRARAAG